MNTATQEKKELTPLQRGINQCVINAKSLEVQSAEDLQLASDYLKQIKTRTQEIHAEFDDNIAKAYALHRGLSAQRKRHLDPVELAKTLINSKVAAYAQEQERIRREKERKAREEAEAKEKKRQEDERKRLEEEKLAAAEKLEKDGNKEAADAVLETPTQVAEQAPVLEHVEEEEKPEGLTFRDNWVFDITNPKEVPDEYKTIDEKKIRGVVKALKSATNIPGVKVYNKKIPIQK